jgi:ABC-type transporter MlaC component
MNRSAGITLAALMLALGLWSMTAYSADDDEAKAIKEAQQDIKKLVEAMKAKNGKVKGQVQAIAKKFDEVKPVMMVYKSRKKGGIGMGKDGENDIEITIGKIGNPRAKGWSGSTGNKKRLDARKDLAMVADLSRALAEVSELYAKKYNDSSRTRNCGSNTWTRCARALTSWTRRPRATMRSPSRRPPPTSPPAVAIVTASSGNETSGQTLRTSHPIVESVMNRSVGIPLGALMLAFGLWSLTAYADDDEIKEAQKAVIKLMDSMKSNKGDVKAQTQAMAKKFDEVQPIMMVYKPRNKGGIGMGPGGALDIEKTIGKVGDAGPKGWTDAKRLQMKGDLAKVADLSRAVAEVSELYANKYKDNNTGKLEPKKWKEYVAQMRKGADELDKAAKGNDAGAIQKAADNLNKSCSNCHSDFR